MIVQHKEYCINSFHGKLWLNRHGNSTTPGQSDGVPTKQPDSALVSCETAPGALRSTPGDGESQQIAHRFSCTSPGSPMPTAVNNLGQQTNRFIEWANFAGLSIPQCAATLNISESGGEICRPGTDGLVRP
jgi:hypothetical protein